MPALIVAPYPVLPRGWDLQQSGTYEIAASREEVWAALNDAEVLGQCITGCQEIHKVDDHQFNAKVKAKVGPVSATFQTEFEIVDPDPPASYTLKGGVKGGAAGFAKGSAAVALAEIAEGTRLTYEVDASVGGKLAQVGSRLVDGAARKMADDFFAAFSAQLSEQSADTDSTAAAADETSTQPPEYERSGLGFVWIVAFGVLVIAMVLAI